jgi:hypothetical protein
MLAHGKWVDLDNSTAKYFANRKTARISTIKGDEQSSETTGRSFGCEVYSHKSVFARFRLATLIALHRHKVAAQISLKFHLFSWSWNARVRSWQQKTSVCRPMQPTIAPNHALDRSLKKYVCRVVFSGRHRNEHHRFRTCRAWRL